MSGWWCYHIDSAADDDDSATVDTVADCADDDGDNFRYLSDR